AGPGGDAHDVDVDSRHLVVWERGVDQEDLRRSSFAIVRSHAVLRARRDHADAEEENVLHRRPPLPPVLKLRPTTARRNLVTQGALGVTALGRRLAPRLRGPDPRS